MTNSEIRARFVPLWSSVRETRRKVEECLTDYPANVRRATAMVASELLENAIKYGEVVPNASEIEFNFTAKDGLVKVAVSNGLYPGKNLDRLKNRIAAIAKAEDRAALYIERLEELVADPTQNAGLGLFRIGCEGAFELTCTHTDNVVTIVATRSSA